MKATKSWQVASSNMVFVILFIGSVGMTGCDQGSSKGSSSPSSHPARFVASVQPMARTNFPSKPCATIQRVNPDYQGGLLIENDQDSGVFCSKDIQYYDLSAVTKMMISGNFTFEAGSFEGFSHLTELTILSPIPTITSNLFAGLSSLKVLTLEGPSDRIEDFAFADLSALKKLYIASKRLLVGKGPGMSVAENAFKGLSNLEKIDVRLYIQSLSPKLFDETVRLKEMQLSSDATIQANSFKNLKNLEFFLVYSPWPYGETRPKGILSGLSNVRYLKFSGGCYFEDGFFSELTKLEDLEINCSNWKLSNTGLPATTTITVGNWVGRPRDCNNYASCN